MLLFRLAIGIACLSSAIRCTGQDLYRKIPIEIIDQRPFIETIIGRDTLHFMLDTGAVNVIDWDLAQKLNLPQSTEYQQQGAGAGRRTAYETQLPAFSIGGLVFENQTAVALSLKEVKEKMGLPYLDGLLGYDLFKDRIIQIHYVEKYFSFLPTYTSVINGIPFRLYRNQIPLIQVPVFDTLADFIVDTGDRFSLTLNTPFAAQNQLHRRYALSDTTVTGYGIGGAIHGQTFTLKSLKIQHLTYQEVLCRIPTAKTGGFARTDFSGSIGGGLLQKKVLTVNYQTKVLFIE